MVIDSERLTVIIPTFDRARVLPRAIQSVLQQGNDLLELIVVDDASTDDTPTILAKLQAEDRRLRHVRNDTNRGNAIARNTGVAQARGEWIVFLDDDDEMLPGCLAAIAVAVKNAPPDLGFLWCGIRCVKDSKEGEIFVRDEVWRPRFGSREAAYRGFLANRRVGTNCGLTIRRTAFSDLGGFDETIDAAVDTEFLIRAARRFDYRVVPEVLVKVHFHQKTQIRRNTRARAKTYQKIIEKHRVELEADPKLAASLFYKAGWLFYHSGDAVSGRSALLNALRHRPLWLKSWGALALFELLGQQGISVHKRLSSLYSGRTALGGEP